TLIEDTHYPRDPAIVELLPGVGAGLRMMHEKGYLLFVISNQSGVGRGIISDTQFKAVHEKVCHLLQGQQVQIEEFSYCFHHPEDDCECRKPKTGLVPRRWQDKPIEMKSSFVIGDRDADLLVAERIGAQGWLVLTGKGKATLDSLQTAPINFNYKIGATLLEI